MLDAAATAADDDGDGADSDEYDCGGGADGCDSDAYDGCAKSQICRSAYLTFEFQKSDMQICISDFRSIGFNKQ